jgi:hypothetical protein
MSAFDQVIAYIRDECGNGVMFRRRRVKFAFLFHLRSSLANADGAFVSAREKYYES